MGAIILGSARHRWALRTGAYTSVAMTTGQVFLPVSLELATSGSTLDLVPNAFTFTDVTGATTNTLYTSNTITLAGMTAGTPVGASVVGGEYQLNGNAWTSLSSFPTQNGDTIRVRATSSANSSTVVSVTLTVGGVSDTYSVTTAADATAPTLSSPIGTSTGTGTATIGATTNEANGTLYGVITTSSTAPTGVQVEAGQNNLGTTAVWAGSLAITTVGAKTLNATSLSAGTAYYAHLMHKDAAGNRSAVVSSLQFTTSAGPPIPITAPVITQTSTAGASPLLFTASLNTSDTYAGYTMRVQVAANTSSDFTTPTQDILHLLTESEITTGDIDITTDGFATPSGAYSLRVRIERDDGTVSAWSNVITGTITAATAQWAGTNGFDKHNLATTSGTPRLTVVGSSAGFAYVRSTQSAVPNEFVWEFTIGASVSGRLGMDDRAIDFTSYSGFPAGFSGDGFYLVLSTTSSDLWANNGGLNVSGLTNGALAAGDIITVRGNKTTGLVKFHRTRSGTTVALGSSSGYTLTGMASWYIYHGDNSGAGGTLNTGQSTFAYTMTGSEAIFG